MHDPILCAHAGSEGLPFSTGPFLREVRTSFISTVSRNNQTRAVRALILPLARFGIAQPGAAKKIEKEWALYRKPAPAETSHIET